MLTIDKLPQLKLALAQLAKQSVLVGVPAEKNARKDENDGMNNAQIAYVQDNGSPAQNIPPRPFMREGVQNIKSKITYHLIKGAKSAIEDGANPLESLDATLHKVGLITQDSIRKRINSNIPPPLSEYTLEKRKERKFKGTKTLIETGQLRNSINYVIRDN